MSADDSSPGLPPSILDTDLYKLTMQQAVLHHFSSVSATYRFTHRDSNVFFSRKCTDQFRSAVNQFHRLSLTNQELEWLGRTCPYLKPRYLDYLYSYRFKPEQVEISFHPIAPGSELGHLEITASGPWVETILWEVPLMACLSEIYFRTVVTDWNHEGQTANAYKKASRLLEAGCVFSEFGTRRRRSFLVQDLVVQTLIRASQDLPNKGRISGTSNVHLAQKYNILPIGTVAHEWFMGVAALKGYQHANAVAMDLWEDLYRDVLLIALTDTFTTGTFYKEFVADPSRADRWQGLRQDSGDPYAFAPRAKAVYNSLGIDHSKKSIIFSDSLDLDKTLRLKKQCDELGLVSAFGIGTFLTNDFYTLSSRGSEKSKSLNMVIKLSSVDGHPCVKISDDLNKNTGDPETVAIVKQLFALPS